LESIYDHPTLEAQIDRYKSRGFSNTIAIDLWNYWHDCVPIDEKERIAKLEIFDEIEEWKLLVSHYCFVFASRRKN
jgi:hypothetical protein